MELARGNNPDVIEEIVIKLEPADFEDDAGDEAYVDTEQASSPFFPSSSIKCEEFFPGSIKPDVQITALEKDEDLSTPPVAVTSRPIKKKKPTRSRKAVEPVAKPVCEEDLSKYICPQCGKQCTGKVHFRSHVRYHNRSHKCPECPLTFITVSNMKIHLQTHTGAKPYICEVCGKAFATRQYLKYHLALHIGVRNQVCETCGATFVLKSQLTKHSRRHSDDKPHCCEVCGKSFARFPYLKSHMLTHTGVRKYNCSVCDRAFMKRIHLSDHMVTHTKQRNFTCDICLKTYTKKSIVIRHKKRVHKLQDLNSITIIEMGENSETD